MSQNVKPKWTPTVHATQRLKERFGISPEQAQNFVNQVMMQAKYMHAAKGDKLAYYYEKRDMMILVNPEEKVIVTVHEGCEKLADAKKPSRSAITVQRISDAIKRELRLLTAQLSREVRRLTEQQAELSLRVAELTLNKARCKAPHTRKLIQSRIEEVTTHVNYLALEIDAKMAEIKQAETEVNSIIAE